jgi:hypothetical protein
VRFNLIGFCLEYIRATCQISHLIPWSSRHFPCLSQLNVTLVIYTLHRTLNIQEQMHKRVKPCHFVFFFFFWEMKTVLVKIGSLQFICTGFSISTKSCRLATIWFDVLVNLATIWFVVVMMLVQGLHDNANKATVIINFNKSSQSLQLRSTTF